MPWKDRSISYIKEVEAMIGCLQSVVDRFMGCTFVYGGDFNLTENATNELSRLLHDFFSLNNLQWLVYVTVMVPITLIILMLTVTSVLLTILSALLNL